MAVEMWNHFCTAKEAVMGVQKGQPCNWCDAKEKVEECYQGLYWAYPLQKYLRWPEYMEYHYWESKKSS